MKESKRVLTLDSAEYRLMLHGLLGPSENFV